MEITNTSRNLNFEITGLGKNWQLSNTSLILNYEMTGIVRDWQLSNTSRNLNFDVREFYMSVAIVKILLDFIETFSVGDIF